MTPRRGLAHAEAVAFFLVAGLFTAAILQVSVPVRGEGREAALRDGLEVLRTAVEMYRFQHEGRWPVAGTTDPAAFERALVGSGDGRFGPYVVGRLPRNPYNGLRTVRVVTDGDQSPPDDATGWIYDSLTGAIRANSPGTDDAGRPLTSL